MTSVRFRSGAVYYDELHEFGGDVGFKVLYAEGRFSFFRRIQRYNLIPTTITSSYNYTFFPCSIEYRGKLPACFRTAVHFHIEPLRTVVRSPAAGEHHGGLSILQQCLHGLPTIRGIFCSNAPDSRRDSSRQAPESSGSIPFQQGVPVQEPSVFCCSEHPRIEIRNHRFQRSSRPDSLHIVFYFPVYE